MGLIRNASGCILFAILRHIAMKREGSVRDFTITRYDLYEAIEYQGSPLAETFARIVTAAAARLVVIEEHVENWFFGVLTNSLVLTKASRRVAEEISAYPGLFECSNESYDVSGLKFRVNSVNSNKFSCAYCQMLPLPIPRMTNNFLADTEKRYIRPRHLEFWLDWRNILLSVDQIGNLTWS